MFLSILFKDIINASLHLLLEDVKITSVAKDSRKIINNLGKLIFENI